ncbi:Transmembrane amino acid transporter-like protein 3 [Elsinoe fawcettii]|nr:Transmembrane amino acid transporter-like protein 3 [Elsinoe fawcettii]
MSATVDKVGEKDLTREETGYSTNVGQTEIMHDAVFGQITTDGPNYRNVGWLGTSVLMMKTQIGLGVLSIPAVFDVLGMIPGIICLLIIGGITTWSDYIVGVFKRNHPSVYGIDDAGFIMLGRYGKGFFLTAFCLYFTFVAGAGMLGVSTAFNALSSHGACTAIFVAVACVLGFIFASIQTLSRVSFIAWVGVSGILISIFMLTIAVGVEGRPEDAPQEGVWVSDYKLIANPSITEALAAVSSLVFAYAGTPAFFPIVSEMREPKDYKKSLVLCQTVVTLMYTVIGIVVYYYCGSYVASPALGSAGSTMKKACYGLALPGLLVTVALTTHLVAKAIFVRALRNSRHLATNTPTHRIVWLALVAGTSIVAYIIASAIPVFGGLVSLIGALLGTLMSFQPMGGMWLYDNWNRTDRKSMRWTLMVVYSVFVIVSGTFLMIGGTYASIVGIIDSYKAAGGSAAWSCADNSNSS